MVRETQIAWPGERQRERRSPCGPICTAAAWQLASAPLEPSEGRQTHQGPLLPLTRRGAALLPPVEWGGLGRAPSLPSLWARGSLCICKRHQKGEGKCSFIPRGGALFITQGPGPQGSTRIWGSNLRWREDECRLGGPPVSEEDKALLGKHLQASKRGGRRSNPLRLLPPKVLGGPTPPAIGSRQGRIKAKPPEIM